MYKLFTLFNYDFLQGYLSINGYQIKWIYVWKSNKKNK